MSNKVQYDNKIGIDLDQVIAWKFFPSTENDPSPTLKLFIPGESFTVRQQDLQEADFTDLHNRLIEEFNDDDVRTSGVGIVRRG